MAGVIKDITNVEMACRAMTVLSKSDNLPPGADLNFLMTAIVAFGNRPDVVQTNTLSYAELPDFEKFVIGKHPYSKLKKQIQVPIVSQKHNLYPYSQDVSDAMSSRIYGKTFQFTSYTHVGGEATTKAINDIIRKPNSSKPTDVFITCHILDTGMFESITVLYGNAIFHTVKPDLLDHVAYFRLFTSLSIRGLTLITYDIESALKMFPTMQFNEISRIMSTANHRADPKMCPPLTQLTTQVAQVMGYTVPRLVKSITDPI